MSLRFLFPRFSGLARHDGFIVGINGLAFVFFRRVVTQSLVGLSIPFLITFY
jgi:hypothetical protein